MPPPGGPATACRHSLRAVRDGAWTLSRYDASLSSRTAKLEEVSNPRLCATSYQRSRPQLRLFGLEDTLGEGASDGRVPPRVPVDLPDPYSRRSCCIWAPSNALAYDFL